MFQVVFPNPRLLLVRCSYCALLPLVLGWPLLAAAQNNGQPPVQPNGVQDHSWARFGVGSWKLVRISKEVFDNGKLESVTIQEGKATLIAVQEDRFKLQEEVTLEVAGKRFKSATRTIERGLYNQSVGQTVASRLLNKGNVVICRREYPSQIHEIIVSDDKIKRVSQVYYSPDVHPYILKSNTKFTDLSGAQTNYEASVEVLAVDMPHRVLSETKSAAHLKTVHVQGNLTTVTLEVSCADVPGQIVAHTAKTVNAEGQLTERSTLELLEYEVVSKQADASGLGRRRLLGKRRLRGKTR